jgi:hypothetical protein
VPPRPIHRKSRFCGPILNRIDSFSKEQNKNIDFLEEALWMALASPPTAIAELRRWLERVEAK